MFIREHEVVAGFCLHCGAREDAIKASIQEDGDCTLSCLQRERPAGAVMPEPTLRKLACEDADAISERMTELAMEREAIIAGNEQANEAVCFDANDTFVWTPATQYTPWQTVIVDGAQRVGEAVDPHELSRRYLMGDDEGYLRW